MAKKNEAPELNELQLLLQIRELLIPITRYVQHQSGKEDLFINQIAANVKNQLNEAAAKAEEKPAE